MHIIIYIHHDFSQRSWRARISFFFSSYPAGPITRREIYMCDSVISGEAGNLVLCRMNSNKERQVEQQEELFEIKLFMRFDDVCREIFISFFHPQKISFSLLCHPCSCEIFLKGVVSLVYIFHHDYFYFTIIAADETRHYVRKRNHDWIIFLSFSLLLQSMWIIIIL